MTNMHLVITNIQKRPNIRALLVNAAAFGCSSVLMVGQPNFKLEGDVNDLPGTFKGRVLVHHVPSSKRKNKLTTRLNEQIKNYFGMYTIAIQC